MTLYAKIDRATGNVLKTKHFDAIERDLSKPQVWIELENPVNPDYDPDTQKLVPDIQQPDMSDLNVDVSPTVKRVQGVSIVALSAQELQERVDQRVSATDDQLVKAVELIFVQIATGTSRMKRTDFPNAVWNKINARRALRGESPV